MRTFRVARRRWVLWWLFVGVAIPYGAWLFTLAAEEPDVVSRSLPPSPLPVAAAHWLCVAVPEHKDAWPLMHWELEVPPLDGNLFYSISGEAAPDEDEKQENSDN